MDVSDVKIGDRVQVLEGVLLENKIGTIVGYSRNPTCVQVVADRYSRSHAVPVYAIRVLDDDLE